MSRFFNATLSAAAALLLASGTTLMAADAHDHDHGDLADVGTVTLGGIAAKVESEGAPAAGKKWHVEVALPAGTAEPKAIRAWVGSENGRGSEKTKAEPEHPGVYEAHVEVPTPLPDGSKLWISLENAAGETAKASLPLPAAAAPAADDLHKGHKH